MTIDAPLCTSAKVKFLPWAKESPLASRYNSSTPWTLTFGSVLWLPLVTEAIPVPNTEVATLKAPAASFLN